MRSTREVPLSALALVLTISVAMRLGVAIYMGDQVRETLPGINDEISYHRLALSLVAGKGYQFEKGWYPSTPANTPASHWSFAYPACLAGICLLFTFIPAASRSSKVRVCSCGEKH